MTTELKMPQLAMSMTEGEFAEWLVEDGATVEAGQSIYSIESDKSTQEVEAPVSGVLKQVAIVGETYQVGETLGEIA